MSRRTTYCCDECNKIARKNTCKRYSTKHYDKIRCKRLQNRYGITLDKTHEIFLEQKGKCMLCKKKLYFNLYRGFHIDHCHTTGKVRGILCKHCNTALGQLGDTTKRLERVVRYLKGDLK